MNEYIVLSIIGGGLYQLIPVMENINKTNEPIQINNRTILLVLFYCLLGGLAGYAYFEKVTEIHRLMAIQVGISSPLLFRTLADNIPNIIKND